MQWLHGQLLHDISGQIECRLKPLVGFMGVNEIFMALWEVH